MIRVNLIGAPKTVKAEKKGGGVPLAGALLPIVWLAILIGTAAFGYLWYSNLSGESDRLDTEIAAATARQAQLQPILAENAVYEERLATLERRKNDIEQLQRNKLSPVIALDMLSRAISGIEYVWLSAMSQDNTSVTLQGTGTSQNAVADFIESLENTGYFRNINLGVLQEAGPALFTFNLACEFVPPVEEVVATVPQVEAPPEAEAGDQ